VTTQDSGQQRPDRLGPADTRSGAVTVTVLIVAAAILVLPTVILVVPWLDRAP
jgi:hypothetical protein